MIPSEGSADNALPSFVLRTGKPFVRYADFAFFKTFPHENIFFNKKSIFEKIGVYY